MRKEKGKKKSPEGLNGDHSPVTAALASFQR